MVITVQQLIKQKYPMLLRWAGLFTVIIILSAFIFTPVYAPNPYKLKEEVFEIIEVPDEIEIPPPPQEIEMPKVRVEIEISERSVDTIFKPGSDGNSPDVVLQESSRDNLHF